MSISSGPAPQAWVIRKPALFITGWAVLVFVIALAVRLPGLRLFLTSDERTNLYWAGSQFIEGLLSGDLSLTYWHFYPGVTMSWVEAFGLTMAWVLAGLRGNTGETLAQFVRRPILDLIVAARLPYALLTAGGVAGIYLLARRLWGHWTALLGALFIAFDPFFLAHSRVAHGDAPVAVFMGLSVLAFFVYLQAASLSRADHGVDGKQERQPEGRHRWLLLSATWGGLAALTKAPGQFMAPFVILVGAGDWLLSIWRLRRLDLRLARRWVLDLAVWGSAAALIFVALWPAMWVGPVNTLARMIEETFGKVEEGHLVFFMGQPVLKPGFWFYPYVIPFRLTPVTLTGALACVVIMVSRLVTWVRGGEQPGRWPSRYRVALLLWLFTIALFLFGNLSPKKQDRYLLPLFPCLDLLAAFAWVEISAWGSRQVSPWISKQSEVRVTQRVFHAAYPLIRIGLPLTLIAIHALPVVTAYPYYLAYFNPLMGGLPRAVETTLVGWGEGMEQAAAYLNQHPDADRLSVASVPAQTFLPYFRGVGENFYTNDVALRADYVVLYISQVQRLAPTPEIVRYFEGVRPEHVVYVLGVPYAWIYPGPKLVGTDVPPHARLINIGLGDQLRLAGYRISNSQPSTSTLEVTLYWHALTAMDIDYTISVRLVAPDGAWLAQHDGWPAEGLLPTSRWRPGDYVQDVHRLQAPPDAAVDHVQVVVYDVSSGRPLGAPIDLSIAQSGE